ncbi:dephospho-CoA kinase [Nocardioides sp. AX2bis]|uniref:dephospho-CoA kinase n=1 Tax=Nocardioides sp. AX2bis TaxID=2653157 RepID=UPI0012F44743|nr:dephospho-CoA kinase [Nocardioides sp. AX2bis]VXB37061.1 Dephospho-CoA kinase [Nocardioides sp. AX2bis]
MRVGLTGGVASGKSTVSAVLDELGAVVVDSDVIAREVVAPGTPGLAAVVGEFGHQVLAPDGSLDRPALGRLVFGDDEARRRLEGIVHPLVRARAAEVEHAAPAGSLVVHDIPLLVETGQGDRFEVVVVVDVPEDVQMTRMVGDRGWTEEDARARIAAQASREDRLSVATHVLDNTGSVDDLRRAVEELYAGLASG